MGKPVDLKVRDPQLSRAGGDPPDGLSIIVPAYNEEDGIGEVLLKLKNVLEDGNRPFEVLVVDDGSSDRTAAIAERTGGVRILRHGGNRGYGAAIKTGLRHAHYELVCITDADSTYPNHQIPSLIKELVESDVDMVVGARIGANVAIPRIRKPAKWVIRKLAQIVIGERIPDLNSGLRVFYRSSVIKFFNLLPDGYSFTTTITLGMLTNGYLVQYVPIEYYPRVGKSKIRPIRDTLNFIQLVLRIALYFAPLKIFLTLSGLLLFLAGAWAIFSTYVLGRLADASAAVIVMTAVQVAIVGLLADLVNRRLPNFHKSYDLFQQINNGQE